MIDGHDLQMCLLWPSSDTKRYVMLWGAVCQWKTVAADAAEIHGKQDGKQAGTSLSFS